MINFFQKRLAKVLEYPLTAAGGQGPQDNTAYGPCTSDQSPSRAEPCVTVAQPLSCSAYMQNRGQTERPWPSLGPSYPPKVMAIHIQSRPRRTFPASHPPALRLWVQLIYLPAWDYLPSYGMGPYTIVRYGTIGYRTDSLFQIANTL